MVLFWLILDQLYCIHGSGKNLPHPNKLTLIPKMAIALVIFATINVVL